MTFLKYNDVIAPIKVEIAATRVIIKANQISDDAKLVMIYPYFLFILNHLWFCYVIIIKTASVPTGKYRLKTPAILRNSRINGKTKRNIFNDDIIVSQVDSYPESPIRFAVYQFFIVGGNLGAMGCVAFLFNQKGVIDISLEDKDADEAMMDALDAGAEDFDASEDAAEVTTDPENYSAVVKALEEKGYEILSDDLAMVPMTTTRLTDPDQLKAMGKLLDALEENDDVQNVWHSLENEEDLPE